MNQEQARHFNDLEIYTREAQTTNQIFADLLDTNQEAIDPATFDKLSLVYNLLNEKLENAYQCIEAMIKAQ